MKRVLLSILGIAVLNLGAATVQGEEALRNSSRECAICHIRWLDALVRTDQPETSMQNVLKRQAGTGDMCLSCHDGSVADSRFKVWSTQHHTTGVVPPPKIKIPTDKFPLDDQGRMTCATCHTAHAVPESSDLKTVIFLRQPNVDSSLCLACHEDHAQKNEFQHPLGHTDQPIPQVILDAGGKTAEDQHTIICQTCHEPHGARNAWMLVLPPSELCIACHTDKSPEVRAPAGAPVHHIGRTYPGFTPPQNLLDERATFGAQGQLSCLSCHRLHDASGAWPLLIRKNEGSDLCLDCHPQKKTLLHSQHDLRFSSPETVNADGKTAAQAGPCGSCHHIHGWARRLVDTDRPHSAGCMECHETGGPGSVHRPYVEGHPVGIAAPNDINIPLPLDRDTGKIGCLTCHDPHTPLPPASTDVNEIEAESIFPTEPNAPRSFLRDEGRQLCVLCHREQAAILSGPHDPAAFTPQVRQELGLSDSMGACRICHTTHNAQGPHLWSRFDPNAPDGSMSGLCRACHDRSSVGRPQQTRHPQIDTDDGPQQCAACHDPHADPNNSGQLLRPLQDLCQPCHKNEMGIISSVHDPAQGPWVKKLDWTSQGPCIDCHPIHSSPEESPLWQRLGGQTPSQQVCELCHSAAMPGKTVVTSHLGQPLSEYPHPDNELHGVIRCTTCHNIHIKDSGPYRLKAPRVGSALCLGCHVELTGLLGSAHDLTVSAPDANNGLHETPAESGPCSVCHFIHRTDDRDTWAYGTAPNHDYGRAYCTVCHQAGQCAAGARPGRADHPDVPFVNRFDPNPPDYMPTFNAEGQPDRRGAISCLTCHDPHLAPGVIDTQSGLTPWSRPYLRPGTQQRLCADCHGQEALWRYLYFHQDPRKP